MVWVSQGQLFLWIASQIKKVGTLGFKELEEYARERFEAGSDNRITIDIVVRNLKVSEAPKIQISNLEICTE